MSHREHKVATSQKKFRDAVSGICYDGSGRPTRPGSVKLEREIEAAAEHRSSSSARNIHNRLARKAKKEMQKQAKVDAAALTISLEHRIVL